MSIPCEAWWGSHACDLEDDHLGVCQCGPADDPCSQYERGHQMARYMTPEGWTEWKEHRA